MSLEVNLQFANSHFIKVRAGLTEAGVKPPPCQGKYVYNLSKFLQVSALSTIINIFTNFHSWR